MSETEIKLFQPLKEFGNYFSDNQLVERYTRDAISLWNNFEIISRKFRRAEINWFQMDVEEH